jgi:hypothetical protein
MSPEVIQLLWYAGFTLLGYFLRHAGVGPLPLPPAPGPAPVPPAIPADHPLLTTLSQALAALLKLLQEQPPAPK